MHALKQARRYIEKHPEREDAQRLARLTLALEDEADFSLTDLYRLSFDKFTLALRILEEWRLDRHYARKLRLFDVAAVAHAESLGPRPAANAAAGARPGDDLASPEPG